MKRDTAFYYSLACCWYIPSNWGREGQKVRAFAETEDLNPHGDVHQIGNCADLAMQCDIEYSILCWE